MTTVYDENYLSDAMKNLGEAFDYAANPCGLGLEGFAELFISTGTADRFGRGEPKLVSGLSGTELVMEIVEKSGIIMTFPEPQTEFDDSPEYWCGWILAFYQWKSGRMFRDIFTMIPVTEIRRLYRTLHEASEEKFVDTAEAIIRRKKFPSKLQQQRKRCGYYQWELAKRAGINLRTLQQYETGAKDIRKASAATVFSLAGVLGCRPEELLG